MRDKTPLADRVLRPSPSAHIARLLQDLDTVGSEIELGPLELVELVNVERELMGERRRDSTIRVLLVGATVVSLGALGIVGQDLYYRAYLSQYSSPPYVATVLSMGAMTVLGLLSGGALADWLFRRPSEGQNRTW